MIRYWLLQPWRLRNPDPEKPMVYFPSECKNQEHHWYKFLSVNTGRSMSQRKDSQAEREFFLIQPFIPFRPSTDWTRPSHIGRAICFTQSPNSNINLI